MASLTKEKILGQFFSGDKIPGLLVEIMHLEHIKNAIDPMCGRGDMFKPLYNSGIDLVGIEVDKDAADIAKCRYPLAHINVGNAFSKEVLESVIQPDGYELVITNPPYVRRELLNPASSMGFHNDLSTIKNALEETLSICRYITDNDKKDIADCIHSISNLADLSIPSWILCMMLLKPGGQLALVVPTAWMSREYARPITSLLNKLCRVDYIIVDANRIWFKDSAQIQTSMILARRKKYDIEPDTHTIKYVRLFASANSDSSLIGRIPENIDFLSSIRQGNSMHPFFEVDCLSSDRILNSSGPVMALCSKLSAFTNGNNAPLATLEDFKINVGQGLRTGANKFFHLKHIGKKCHSIICDDLVEYSRNYFYPLIKCQEALSMDYSISEEPDDVVLYIQDAALEADVVHNSLFNAYNILPESLSNYIYKASLTKVNGKNIPELSAVRTNASKGSRSRKQRFWYMLPKAGDRHYAHVFIPRVNSGKIIARMNTSGKDIFLDANFTNLWPEPTSELSEFALLAILNCTWLAVQFEEFGSVMGGGALKLDAAQIKKCVIPSGITQHAAELDSLGRQLSETTTHNGGDIIRNIDRIFFDALHIHDTDAMEKLENILESYIACRN